MDDTITQSLWYSAELAAVAILGILSVAFSAAGCVNRASSWLTSHLWKFTAKVIAGVIGLAVLVFAVCASNGGPTDRMEAGLDELKQFILTR